LRWDFFRITAARQIHRQIEERGHILENAILFLPTEEVSMLITFWLRRAFVLL